MLHINLEGGIKNQGSTNKYTKFGQLIIRKIIKIAAARCHIFRLKCTKFYSVVHPFVFDTVDESTRRHGGDRGGRRWCAEAVRLFIRLSVRSFVRVKLHLRDGQTDSPSVCLLDGVLH